MDLDYSLNEKIIIVPKEYPIKFKALDVINNHYALLGVGCLIDNYPLFADAINEYGLGFCALNFPFNCNYYELKENAINLAPYELCLYLLSKFKSVKEVLKELDNINVVNLDFSTDIKVTPLHFMISDKKESIVIETLKDGIKIYNNPYDILTNNPPFYYHKENIINYIHLDNLDSKNNLNKKMDFKPYSYGMNALGLPGDFSSSSRFVRGFFVKSFLDLNSDMVIQFFKCLDSISMVKGCVKTILDYEYSRYTTCYDLNEKVLYYKTYFNYSIYRIDLFNEDINSSVIIYYEFNEDNNIIRVN